MAGLEKAKEYLAMLEVEKYDIGNADIEAVITAKVDKYALEVRAEVEAERDKKLEEKSVEIESIKRFIGMLELEEEKARFLAEQERLAAEALKDLESDDDGELELPEGVDVSNV